MCGVVPCALSVVARGLMCYCTVSDIGGALQ